MAEKSLQKVVVLLGEQLTPVLCDEFSWSEETGRITRIVPSANQPHPFTIMNTMICSGQVISPAFYNSHTHLGDSCLPDGVTGLTLAEAFFRPAGYKYQQLQRQTPEDLVAAIAAHQGYMARTGTIAHCDFREQGLEGCRLMRQAEAQSGVRSIICSQLNESPLGEAELLANKPETDLPPSAAEELVSILTSDDEKSSDGFSESTMNDLTDTAWQTIRRITTAHGKLRAIHCLESSDYRSRSEAMSGGHGDLERALRLLDPDLIVHLTVANDSEIALLASSGKPAVLCPRANANLGLPLPPIAKLLSAGVRLLLGTDNGMLNSPNLLAELDFSYKLAKSQFGDAVHPDPVEILRMVTTNAIRTFQPNEPLIGLVEQAPADFVVMNFNAKHLRQSQHIIASIVTRVTPEDVVATYRNGHPLFSC